MQTQRQITNNLFELHANRPLPSMQAVTDLQTSEIPIQEI